MSIVFLIGSISHQYDNAAVDHTHRLPGSSAALPHLRAQTVSVSRCPPCFPTCKAGLYWIRPKSPAADKTELHYVLHGFGCPNLRCAKHAVITPASFLHSLRSRGLIKLAGWKAARTLLELILHLRSIHALDSQGGWSLGWLCLTAYRVIVIQVAAHWLIASNTKVMGNMV
jgi:hypothetical protein